MLGPGDFASLGKRITGIRRRMTVAYLVKRDGNRCAIADPEFCIMKDHPFADPLHADIDHIKIESPPNQRLSNLRLACSPCNSHVQKFQWKSNRTASTRSKRESQTSEHPHSLKPTSGETASSWKMFPKTVEDAFHPIKGRLAQLNDEVLKDWWVNNLPEIIGLGRATTFAKYIHEFVSQGYLTEEPGKDGVRLVRTGKRADEILWRELGIRSPEQLDKEQVKLT
jgi:hypothetical protein